MLAACAGTGADAAADFRAGCVRIVAVAAAPWPKSYPLSSAVSFGLSSAAAIRGSATTALARSSIADHAGSAFSSRASRNAASAYGRAIVVSSAISSPSQLLPNRREEIRVGDELAVEAEAVLVARDPETRRSRPLLDAERRALERS